MPTNVDSEIGGKFSLIFQAKEIFDSACTILLITYTIPVCYCLNNVIFIIFAYLQLLQSCPQTPPPHIALTCQPGSDILFPVRNLQATTKIGETVILLSLSLTLSLPPPLSLCLVLILFAPACASVLSLYSYVKMVVYM